VRIGVSGAVGVGGLLGGFLPCFSFSPLLLHSFLSFLSVLSLLLTSSFWGILVWGPRQPFGCCSWLCEVVVVTERDGGRLGRGVLGDASAPVVSFGRAWGCWGGRS